MVYCFNRPCSLRALAWPQPAGAAAAGHDLSVPLAGSLGSAFSPRFSPDGATLVFLSQQNAISSGTHNGTCTLHSLRWADARAALTGGAAPPPKTGGHCSRALLPLSSASSAVCAAAAAVCGNISYNRAGRLRCWQWWIRSVTPAQMSAPFLASGKCLHPLPPHLPAVVDTVWNPASPEEFPGLYCTALPDQPFLPGGHTLLLTTQWRR